ncbi:MAG: family 16 glycosylhydrolase [Cryomorphaceae bacterium]
MKFLSALFFVTLVINSHAADVTFKLNMAGFEGFGTPEVNGTFNGWCGNCNAMSDPDGDGVWETTVDIPTGTIEYIFSFDNWSGQEELSYETDCVAGPNRILNVTGDVELDPVCWSLCSNCLVPDEEIWALDWSDEFEGNSLDMDTWSHEFGSHGWGNNELQMYTSSPENTEVSDGTLKITARQENVGGASYSSSRIRTINKMEFLYGKVEARIKVPIGQGIWPAFWMLGANFEEDGWPFCGEIDVMEHVNNEPMTNSAIHWFDGEGHTYDTKTAPFDGSQWHVYGADWNEDGVTFILDDQPYFHFPFEDENNTAPIFTKPFFFLLNIAVGGNWPGSPDGTTQFPAVMEVDYVRIFQKSGLNTERSDQSHVRIFPVPTVDEVNVDFGTSNPEREIKVFNSSGQMIDARRAADDRIRLDLSGQAPGVYIIHIMTSDNDSRSFKIVKQ